MTRDERARVLEAARKARYPGLDVVISMLSLCGLRRGELLALAWTDIDLDSRPHARPAHDHRGWWDGNVIIREQTKTGCCSSTCHPRPDRPAPPPQGVQTAKQAMGVRHRLNRRDPFLCFPEVGGHPMRPHRMTSLLRSLMRSAGVKGVQPVHGHRHSMASHMLAEGVDLKVVSKRLGHSSTPAITHDLYTHVVEDKDREAVELLEKVFEGSDRGSAEQIGKPIQQQYNIRTGFCCIRPLFVP